MLRKNKIAKGVIRYDENGNPQTIASTKQRAEEIFRVRKITFTFCWKVKQNLYLYTIAKCWLDEMNMNPDHIYAHNAAPHC